MLGEPEVEGYIDNKFRVDALIGTGGMGCIYRAEHVALKRAVAIKVLHPRLAADKTLTQRFLLEARAASRLSHPNIVTILDFGQEAKTGRLYLVMELLEGTSLQELQQAGIVRLPRALDICRQILLAIDEAHSQGVVHRDLKPENIVVIHGRQDELIKVVDFGLAQIKGAGDDLRLTGHGVICGTPAYVSPEQARAEQVGPASDIYSFGVILFELVTGRLPFTANSPYLLVFKHLSDPVPHPATVAPDRNIPDELSAIILRCLEKDPQARFPSALAVHDALLAVLAALPDARPTPVPARRLATPEALGAARRATLPVMESTIFLVGRDAECRMLEEAGLDLMAGRGGAIVVRGGPGMGKSVLLLDAVESLRSRGVRTCVARAMGEGAGPGAIGLLLCSLLAFEHASPDEIRIGLEARCGAELDAIDRAALLGVMIGDDAEAVLDPEVAKMACKTAVRRLLQTECARRPMVLVLDDAHNLCGRDRALLAAILRGCRDLPFLLVLSADTTDARSYELCQLADGLLGTPALAGSGAGLRQLELQPLTPEATRSMLSRLAIDRCVPARVVDQIVELSAGCPLFVAETAHFVEGSGGSADGSAAEGTEGATLPIPSGLRPLIIARCDILDGVAKKVLFHAAATGKSFSRGFLAALVGEPGLQASLDSLCAQHLLEPVGQPGSSYRFSHEIVREVVYGRMTEVARSFAHDAIASAMLGIAASGTSPATVANHLELAGRLEEAAEQLDKAGLQRLRQDEPADAAELFRRALDALERTPAGAEIDEKEGAPRLAVLRLHLARALNDAGLDEEARIQALAVRDLALGQGFVLFAARATRELARVATDPSGAWLADSLLGEAYDAALACADRELAAELARDRAEVRERGGNPEGAIATLAAAMQDLEGISAAAQAGLLNTLGRALLQIERFDAAIDRLRAAVDLAGEVGGTLLPRALGNMANAQAAAGRTGAALETLLKVRSLAQQTGDRLTEAKALHNSARLSAATGERVAAQALARDCRSLCLALDWPEGLELTDSILGQLGAMEQP